MKTKIIRKIRSAGYRLDLLFKELDRYLKILLLRRDIKRTKNYMHFTAVEIYNIMHAIEIDITEQCNLSCTACVRSCGFAPSNRHMTTEEVAQFVKDSIDLNWKWDKIGLLGGEPTLHPQLLEIIDVIKKYKDFNNQCFVLLMTNGTDAAAKVLPKIPSWIYIFNTKRFKKWDDANHAMPFNVAPIDVGEWHENNLVKCWRPVTCGMGLTKDGYFFCHNAGSIHRVFGLGDGIRKLKDVTFKALDNLLPLSCRYCGFYFETDGRYKKYDIHRITESWKNAYKKYNPKQEAIVAK